MQSKKLLMLKSTVLALLFLPFSIQAQDEFSDALLEGHTIDVYGLPTTMEQYNSRAAYQINADFLWKKGYRGKGIVVGVIDSGISTASKEFGPRVLKGYNAINRSSNVVDKVGHGTHIAGIIGAGFNRFGMIGVAPEVKLLPIKIFDTGGASSAVLANALNWSIGRTRIVNLSLGSSAPMLPGQFAKNIAAGQLLIAAAGNEGGANPIWPARYAKESWARGQIIAVGAVDSNNEIAEFSNRAGDARHYYVVAPGTGILSTYPGVALHSWSGTYANYGIMSGTSMATPYVTGLAASIARVWPRLKANQIAGIIFKTATPLGSAPKGQPDEIYGWGLVNAERAFAPIGTPKVPTKRGSAFPINNTRSSMLSMRAAGDSLNRAGLYGAFQSIALDDFGRDYDYDLSATVATANTAIPLGQIFASMDSRLRLVEAELPGNVHFRATALDAAADYNPLQVTSFAVTKQFNDGSISLGTANFSQQYFGFSETPFATAGFVSNPLNNPYQGFARASGYAGFGQALGDGWAFKAGLLSSGAFSTQPDNVNPAYLGLPPQLQNESGSYRPTHQFGLVELERNFEQGKISLTTSLLGEEGSMLGSHSSGLFALDDATTMGMTVSSAYKLNSNLWLAAQATYGATRAAQGNSLISGSNSVRTTAYSLGLLWSNLLKQGDAFGFYLSQPLKVVEGALDLEVPVAVANNGDLLFQRRAVSLAPDATEIDLEANYAARLSARSSISGALILRHNPGHIANAENDAVFALRWMKAF